METYAVSLENVEETLLVHKKDIRYVHGNSRYNGSRRDFTLGGPGGDIGNASRRGQERGEPCRGCSLVGRDRVRVGFRVDAFVGQQEIVIKPLEITPQSQGDCRGNDTGRW